jgi:hypothetical protein
MLGAGQLASTVWKSGDEASGWRYRFSLFRMPSTTGRVSQLLRTSDLPSLVKLCQVLAATLAEDGCVPAKDRAALRHLASRLDRLTDCKE